MGREMRINVSNGAPMGGSMGSSGGNPSSTAGEYESNIIFVGNLNYDTDSEIL